MEINKIGFRITTIIFIASLCLTFIPCEWISNFAFAILGSSIISAFICLINYYVIRKNMVNEVSRHLYTLANTYRLLVCNIQSQKEIVINDFCNEIHAFIDCCERSYDTSRGMFRIVKKEKIFEKCIVDLSNKIIYYVDCCQNTVAIIKKDLKNSVEPNLESFKSQVKPKIGIILKIIAKIENCFYSKKELQHKKEIRLSFKEEFGEINE